MASRSCFKKEGVRQIGYTSRLNQAALNFNHLSVKSIGSGRNRSRLPPQHIHGRSQVPKLSICDGSMVESAHIRPDFRCSVAAVPEGMYAIHEHHIQSQMLICNAVLSIFVSDPRNTSTSTSGSRLPSHPWRPVPWQQGFVVQNRLCLRQSYKYVAQPPVRLLAVGLGGLDQTIDLRTDSDPFGHITEQPGFALMPSLT